MALAGLKSNRKQLQNQLSALESELVFCYLPGKMKDNLINSLIEALEVLDEEITQFESQITFQALNQGLGLQSEMTEKEREELKAFGEEVRNSFKFNK